MHVTEMTSDGMTHIYMKFHDDSFRNLRYYLNNLIACSVGITDDRHFISTPLR
jgi:hypothetical protein